jgi:uncharacterized protein YkwD
MAVAIVGALCAASDAKPPAPEGFAKLVVDAHNRARGKHCAPPLAWSAKLAASAQSWARRLRDRGCPLVHSGGHHGENLAAGTAGVLDPDSVVAMWYDEIQHYSFAHGGFSMDTGHFTQLVWRRTKEVGCGVAHCRGLDVWVCQYDPPGNMQGEYPQNVRPTSCR